MSVLLALAVSICMAAGVWLLLSRDVFRMIMGLAVLGASANLVMFMALVTVVVNFIVDLMYASLDPRIKYAD